MLIYTSLNLGTWKLTEREKLGEKLYLWGQLKKEPMYNSLKNQRLPEITERENIEVRKIH